MIYKNLSDSTHELVEAIGGDLNVEYDDKIKKSSAGERIKRRLKKEGLDSS